VAGKPVRLFLSGFSFPFRGIHFLLKNPELLIYVIIPAVINLFLLFLALVGAIVWTPDLIDLFWTRPMVDGFWDGLLLGLWVVLTVLVGIVLTTLSFVCVWAMAGILATPFTDYLSEKVEERILGPREEPFSVKVFIGDVRLSVCHSLLNLALYLVIMLPLLLLNLIPVAGSVLFVVLSSIVTSFFMARDMLDGPLSRRRLTFRQKVRIIIDHKALMSGLGAATACLLWIPFLNFLCLPIAATGGALLYCRLATTNQLSFLSMNHL